MIGTRLRMILAYAALWLSSSGTFGATPRSLEGRVYADHLRRIEFWSEYNGRVIEGDREFAFAYTVENQVVSFGGDDLKPEFRRAWLIMPDGSELTSADGRIGLSLVRFEADAATESIAFDSVEASRCPSVCRGIYRCWYTEMSGGCVLDACAKAKSCE